MMEVDPVKELAQIKKNLKSWESMFQKRHGHKPSKEDVQNSPSEIKDAYKDYQRLKDKKSTCWKTHTENIQLNLKPQPMLKTRHKISNDPLKPSNIFSAHLNKTLRPTGDNLKEKVGVNRPQETRKWIKGCGFRKTTEPPPPKKEDKLDEVVIVEEVDISDMVQCNMRDTSRPLMTPKRVLSDDATTDTFSNLRSTIQKPRLKHGHGISKLWLDNMRSQLDTVTLSSPCKGTGREKEGTGINRRTQGSCLVQLETSVKEILASSSNVCSRVVNPFMKNLSDNMEDDGMGKDKQLDPCSHTEYPHSQSTETDSHSNTTIAGLRFDRNYSHIIHANPDSHSIETDSINPDSHSIETDSHSIETHSHSIKTDSHSIDTDSHSDSYITSDEDTASISDSIATHSSHSSMDTFKDDETLDYFEQDPPPPSFQSEDIKSHHPVTIPHQQSTTDGDNWEDGMEQEGRGSSGCGSRGRGVALDEVVSNISTGDESITHSLTTVDRGQPRVTSELPSQVESDSKSKGSVSDNFIRLNMKVKRFSRKPMRITGSKYKRQQWKQRQKGKGNEGAWSGGGSSRRSGVVCFRCGRPGHWARNCTGTGGFKNLGSFDGHSVSYTEDSTGIYEESYDSCLLEEKAMECVYPTVEEACALMAATTGGRNDVAMETVDGFAATGKPCYKIVEPFLELEDGKVVDSVPDEVLSNLNTLGYEEFRSGQKATVLQILSGVSTILVMPTGSGKSLCYQLPAYCYSQLTPGCVTLVISPLISLMQDQINNLPAGVTGACIHNGLSKQQRDKIINDLGAGKISVLLISPETLVGGATGSGWSFLSASKLPPIAFACIDEAHCLSEWSHNFRPSYFRLSKVLRETLGIKCILALTATASNSTIEDMTALLGVRREHVITGPAVPDNLILSVSCESDREQALVDLLQSPPFSECDSIIIYCTRQQTTERVAQLLRTSLQLTTNIQDNEKKRYGKEKKSKKRKVSWGAECYHAGLSPAQRKRNQSDFMTGRLRVIVCTVAFGMGLDKPDVRAVIHYNMPKSFESFVQEIGRAGRDGNPAHCHVFVDKEGSDLLELRRHIYANSVDQYTVKQMIQKALPTMCNHDDEMTQENGECNGHEVAIPIESLVESLDVKEEILLTLLCYLELQNRINLFNPINDTCNLKCYGGTNELRRLSRKVPAVAMAVALEKEQGSITDSSPSVTFSLTQISNALGYDAMIIQQVLRDLSYCCYGNTAQTSASNTVMVEFTNQSFHLKTKTCFNHREKDTICQELVDKIKSREERELERLYQLYAVLKHVSNGNDSNSSLNKLIQLYFDDKLTTDHLCSIGIDTYQLRNIQPLSERMLSQIRSDIRMLISSNDDRMFTGRAVARILQGISSPRYPAEVWGRKVFHWRKYLNVDFSVLCDIATDVIINN